MHDVDSTTSTEQQSIKSINDKNNKMPREKKTLTTVKFKYVVRNSKKEIEKKQSRQ